MAASRKALFAPPVLFLALASAWSGYWYLGSHLTGAAIANWMTRESEFGRRWICHDQKIGGFPFRFELSCSAVSIEDQRVTVKAGALRAVALAYKPNHVIAELDGPADATLASGQRFNATWSQLRTSTVISGGRLQSYDSVLEGFRAAQIGATGDAALARADSLETHLRPTPNAPEGQPSFDVAVDGKGVASPLIDAFLRTNDPGDLTLRATMTRADAIGAGHPIDNLERWRLAGGNVSIAQLKISRGRINVDAVANLAIDDNRMIAGRVEGTAAGLEQLLAPGGAMLGGLLNLRPASGPSKGLPFALTLRDGKVLLGPLRLATLQPLY